LPRGDAGRGLAGGRAEYRKERCGNSRRTGGARQTLLTHESPADSGGEENAQGPSEATAKRPTGPVPANTDADRLAAVRRAASREQRSQQHRLVTLGHF
jgi:hypothetical protein